MANQQHEINILKNVIEKSEGISERLKKWAQEVKADIEAELAHLEGKPSIAKASPAPTAEANGLTVNTVASTSTPSAQETLDEKAVEELEAHEGDETATLEELRASGDYTEAELEELCKDHGVTYTAPETPSLQAQGITETASAAPLAGEVTASTAAKG